MDNVHNLFTLASTQTADGVSFNLAFESVTYMANMVITNVCAT